MLQIYLAGPDVFYPDAPDRGKRMKEICHRYGFKGVFPLDGEKPSGNTPQDIFANNMDRLVASDIVVANLQSFRGVEPDSGTVFECGAAYALGKPVFGYAPDLRPMVERVQDEYGPIWIVNDRPADRDGLFIENFGLPLNLMLSIPICLVQGTFEDCIAQVKRWLEEGVDIVAPPHRRIS